MTRRVDIVLEETADTILGIETVASAKSFEAVRQQWLLLRGVERDLGIGSEAVRHVPDEVLNTRPEIPWADITAIGSVNRREYRRVDPATIWSLAADDLPSLKAAIIAVVRK